ncbi:hypothetical protein GCM10012288_22310 [Malaciobacter pacificus]|uniref:Putative phage replication protein n=1 Tax=Malaciobacter pacificus TaxID=1080223 RepID=A0A5C2HCQ2_9BACT|nr:replication endonuclease [Malaciobacter pacificus]QEP34896.1 putative phage replication protein [Malaciobacter pacificus]GGD47612.1 hypothetical protein GCM10012288_22310 [Malaciobacter pacificus]
MYGIDIDDREYIDKKLAKQKKFLKEFVIDFGGKQIDMLDNTYSANINPKKYFSEINNRVNSIHKFGRDNGLMAVFITITAPSKYHPRKTINKKKNITVENPNYEYKNNFEKGVKDAAYKLSDLWHKFTSLQVIRRLKKTTGNGLIYFKVYEPHKSGVPHIHAMVYIPKDWILKVKKEFFAYFKKHNIIQLKFKYTWYQDKGGAVAYMMKYITKTFKNAETDIMDDSAYWYIKHRIIRFSSSRSLAPLCVYRKIRYFFKDIREDDYLYISDLLSENIIQRLFKDQVIEYKTYDYDNDDFIELNLYNKQHIPELSAKKYITAYFDKNGKKKYREISTCFKSRIKLSYKKREQKRVIPIIIDGIEYGTRDNKLVKKIIPVTHFKDLALISYFNKIDKNIDSVDLKHYGLVKNEMIKRDLLDDELIKINSYDTNFGNNCNVVKGVSPKHINFIVSDDIIGSTPFMVPNIGNSFF